MMTPATPDLTLTLTLNLTPQHNTAQQHSTNPPPPLLLYLFLYLSVYSTRPLPPSYIPLIPSSSSHSLSSPSAYSTSLKISAHGISVCTPDNGQVHSHTYIHTYI